MKFELREEVQNHFQELTLEIRSETLGTGVFRVPAPDLGPFKSRTVFVPNLTAQEARVRSVQCIEGTWMPDSLYTHDEILAAVQAGCAPIRCRATSDCPAPSCWWCDPFDGCTT